MSGEGPVWLITGSSSGFGLFLAQHALSRGARVIGTIRKPGTPELKDLESRGAKLLKLDVTDSPEQIKKVVAEAERIYGHIDVLVNNAAYSLLGATEDLSIDACRKQFDTNFFGPLALIQAILPSMRKRKSGTIVNITSIAGLAALPTASMYAGSKHALEALSETLAQEVKQFNINVLLVEPGAFRTNFLGAFIGAEPSEPYQQGPVADTMKMFGSFHEKQPGDPVKAAAIIYDTVEGSGDAGKELKGKTLRLMLGGDCVKRVEAKISSLQQSLDLSRPFAVSTDFDA